MLDVNVEFTKGILFVRLKGFLNSTNEYIAADKVFNIIKDGGIRYLVFNTKEVCVMGDVLLFKMSENLIKDNDGKMLICGSNMNNVAYSYEYVENELSALKLLAA